MPIRSIAFVQYVLVIVFSVLLFFACKPKNNNPDETDASKSPRISAIAYMRDGKFDEAEIAFKRAIKEDANNILNYIDLALLYLNKNSFDDITKLVNDGLKIQPGNISLMQILAVSYLKQNKTEPAKKQLSDILTHDDKNVAAYYNLSVLAAKESDSIAQKNYLLKILDINPLNIAVRLQLSELLNKEGKADSSVFYLQSIKKMTPDFSLLAEDAFKKAIGSLQKKQPGEAANYLQEFRSIIEVSKLYADNIADMELITLPEYKADFNDSRFTQADYKNKQIDPDRLKFTDVFQSLEQAQAIPANISHEVLAVADDDGTGNTYIYVSFSGQGSAYSHYLFKKGIGDFTEVASSAGIDTKAEDLDAVFADYDNDGYQDLFISTTKGIVLYQNRGDGTFSKEKKDIGLNNVTDGTKFLVADFDQDGDLDLYLGCKSVNKFFRNNGDGSFTEQANAMGLSVTSGTVDMDFGDWDSDGDLDIALVTAGGTIHLLNNNRHSKFTDLTDSLKLNNPSFKAGAIAFSDYNNDGMPDLFIGGINGENSYLLKNTGNTGFSIDAASQTISNSIKNVSVANITFIDYDNDGHEDVLISGASSSKEISGTQLFHNDTAKDFRNVSNLLPNTVNGATHSGIADLNLDGDDDVFLIGASGVHFLRNDIGDVSHYMQVQLTGLTYGNNKNNRLGIGAQVELKSGDLYQLKTIRRALTNFGVGVRDSFDAVRIIWPNGTPQYVADPSSRQKFIEQEKLKGSCPFLFGWDGEKYTFLKDMMWRSALGMPLAINGRDTSYAFSDPSQEYLLIPGENLKPKNNKYSFKITEELWEAVYFDKATLTAIDHPDSINVFADEKFVAPPFPGKKVYSVANKNYPVAANEDKGDSILDKIKAYDFQYVSGFDLGKFQGLAAAHDLVLDLGDKAINDDSLHLFLRGWIFPSDASINTSMAQANSYRQHPPSLQVIDKNGNWRTVINNIGFPMGKDKMVIVNLSNKFLTNKDRRIRIQTNMQIYWDEIFFSNRLSHAPVNMHDLAIANASLSYRGYSAMFTKGGPFGPHWCDYYNTTDGQKWRDLTGNYTRYGDVLPLLQHADDEYIIADGGDEISIDFDATNLPPLPKDWKRDFLIYSEGWVKDGDLNTAYGQTVAPLPFHNMTAYPYTGKTNYPLQQHKLYMQQYNTRKVSTDNFKNALKTTRAKNTAGK